MFLSIPSDLGQNSSDCYVTGICIEDKFLGKISIGVVISLRHKVVNASPLGSIVFCNLM